MFEEYLIDAYDFYVIGKEKRPSDIRGAKKYFRASVFYLFSVIDGYINFVGDEYASLLSDEYRAYISDQRYKFSTKTYSIETVREFHSVIEKIKLIIHVFLPDYDFGLVEWNDLMNLKILRDEIVHPKIDDDAMSIDDYEDTIEKGLVSIITLKFSPA